MILTSESVPEILTSAIQMKVIEHYFFCELSGTLYKVVLTFESVARIQKCDIQMRSVEQYFPVVLFIMLSRWF